MLMHIYPTFDPQDNSSSLIHEKSSSHDVLNDIYQGIQQSCNQQKEKLMKQVG